MKTRFNLQPWRAKKRAAKQKQFVAITTAICLAVLALCGFNYYIEKSYIDDQQEAIAGLNQEIANLQAAEKKVKETKDLIAEINKQIVAIEALQSQRGIALQLLEHLANNTPEGVFLNSIKFDGKKLIVEGIAENDAKVADFMRSLQVGKLLDVPVLQGIETAKSSGRYLVPEDAEIKSFTVSVELNSNLTELNDVKQGGK